MHKALACCLTWQQCCLELRNLVNTGSQVLLLLEIRPICTIYSANKLMLNVSDITHITMGHDLIYLPLKVCGLAHTNTHTRMLLISASSLNKNLKSLPDDTRSSTCTFSGSSGSEWTTTSSTFFHVALIRVLGLCVCSYRVTPDRGQWFL